MKISSKPASRTWNRMVMTHQFIALVLFATSPVLAQPDAPGGFRWVRNDALSDEFDGVDLDREKWHDHNPNWVGRPPGKFASSSVSLRDGNLRLQCLPLTPPEGKFTIACGTVQAKTSALYGYYECRMKASRLSTSSNFWFVGGPFETPAGSMRHELIVQFTIGKSKQHNQLMKSNAMVSFKSNKDGAKREKAKTTQRVALQTSVSSEFHTYGCWWVDANTLKFYLDGEYVYTLRPSQRFGDSPYRFPLKLTLVCETFDWQPTPTDEELSNPSKNTTLVDYVRAFRLVKSD